MAKGMQWPSGLEHWTGDREVVGSNRAGATLLWNFGNSTIPFNPPSQCFFGGDT